MVLVGRIKVDLNFHKELTDGNFGYNRPYLRRLG